MDTTISLPFTSLYAYHSKILHKKSTNRRNLLFLITFKNIKRGKPFLFDLIFDTLFDFFSTWQALGLLLMGTVFIAFGLGFICYELYWRLKS
jgi:hypothetical protein